MSFFADDDGGLLVGSEVKCHLVEEWGEELIDSFADDEGVHADAGKDVPGTHGSVVLVHLEAVASRLVDEGTTDEWGGVGIVAAVAMGDALRGKGAHDAVGLLWHAEPTEEEGNVDVRLVALVVELLAEELPELCGQLLLADEPNHARQVHRCAPTILPAGALIEAVAAHLGVGLVDVLELLRPDAVEDFLASLCPFGGIFLHAKLFGQLP